MGIMDWYLVLNFIYCLYFVYIILSQLIGFYHMTSTLGVIWACHKKTSHRVSNKVILKSETSFNCEISLGASFNMILSNKRITKVLIRLSGCNG